MIDEMNDLLGKYREWLLERTRVREMENEWVEVTTPFLDRHNDHIQIYVEKEGDHYVLTDDGFTLRDLRLSGCSIDTPKREQLLKLTLNGFGITDKDGTLTVRSTIDSFPNKKHNLIQAILAVNDMFYLAMPYVTSIFIEDVLTWFESKEIRYVKEVKFTGRSGFDHMFDMVIPKSRSRPERIVKTMNRPSKDSAESLVFSWLDTKEVRAPDSKAYAIINDQDPIPASVISALENYDIFPLLWSGREDFAQELTA